MFQSSVWCSYIYMNIYSSQSRRFSATFDRALTGLNVRRRSKYMLDKQCGTAQKVTTSNRNGTIPISCSDSARQFQILQARFPKTLLSLTESNPRTIPVGNLDVQNSCFSLENRCRRKPGHRRQGSRNDLKQHHFTTIKLLISRIWLPASRNKEFESRNW